MFKKLKTLKGLKKINIVLAILAVSTIAHYTNVKAEELNSSHDTQIIRDGIYQIRPASNVNFYIALDSIDIYENIPPYIGLSSLHFNAVEWIIAFDNEVGAYTIQNNRTSLYLVYYDENTVVTSFGNNGKTDKFYWNINQISNNNYTISSIMQNPTVGFDLPGNVEDIVGGRIVRLRGNSNPTVTQMWTLIRVE